jgi:hypothetical protein
VISNGDTIVKYEDGVVSGEISVTNGTTSSFYYVNFITESGDIGIPPTEEWSLGWIIGNNSIAEAIFSDEDKLQYRFKIEGISAGSTDIVFRLNHNDHKDFESMAIPIVVNPVD